MANLKEVLQAEGSSPESYAVDKLPDTLLLFYLLSPREVRSQTPFWTGIFHPPLFTRTHTHTLTQLARTHTVTHPRAHLQDALFLVAIYGCYKRVPEEI